MNVVVRPITPTDIEVCGRIAYEAFRDIAEQHNFPPDFPSLEVATQVLTFLTQHAYGVVAEWNGQVIGSNFLTEGDAIRAVGPISVDPASQHCGVGRCLMRAVIARGREAAGIRLVQDAFNTTSMSLYASLGFEVKEPLVLVSGIPQVAPLPGVMVRRLREGDVEECAALCRRVHGLERSDELRGATAVLNPFVAIRDGRINAYTTTLTMWQAAHGVAESEANMQALIVGVAAATAQPVSFLLPTRQASLFRWCLGVGLRVIKPLTLMAMGIYHEPRGCYFPSVAY
ncbi:MAG: GNAT family N-acetyltransferase [Deltaproteobacteria bacterium]|nr:GNAT family N-acetyltransferase [Deltaproteobacteria bacterium]